LRGRLFSHGSLDFLLDRKIWVLTFNGHG
jgi:hypothetical protein